MRISMAAESPDKTVANPTEKRPPTGTRFPTETKCQRPDPAASRQFSSRLNIFAACLAFCTAVILGLATVMRCKYNSVLLGFCRRTEPDSGSGMLWIPPAERPVPLAAFRSLSTFGFTPKRNNPSEINPTNSNTNRNNPNRNSPNRNNPSRNLFKPFLRSAPGEEPVDGNADKTLHEDSPILLFMHVWKCAGSSLRCLLREWAELEEQKIAIVVTCTDVVSEGERVCMQDHRLIDEAVQVPRIRESHVVAGHFTWGFQDFIEKPYVMFTTLRNPLELFVSGQQYIRPHQNKHLYHAIDRIGKNMFNSLNRRWSRLDPVAAVAENDGETSAQLGDKDPIVMGFIYRFMDPKVLSTIALEDAAEDAMRKLDTFWLVGVVEQYQGFMAMLQAQMDPLERHTELWERYAVGKYNISPHGAATILGGMNDDLVHEFNQSLAEQWRVYDHAIDLFQLSCHQKLPPEDQHMCQVPLAPSVYALTEREREALKEQAQLGDSESGD